MWMPAGRLALTLLAIWSLGLAAPTHAAEPCCAVTAIDQATGKVTLRDLKTGKTFQVQVADKARLKALTIGAQVDQTARLPAR